MYNVKKIRSASSQEVMHQTFFVCVLFFMSVINSTSYNFILFIHDTLSGVGWKEPKKKKSENKFGKSC